MFVRFPEKTIEPTNIVAINRTISVGGNPSSTCLPVASPIAKTAGTVYPIVASAEPSAMFTVLWSVLSRAARQAANPSGARTSSATTKPANA